jgi:cyanophycinase
MTKRTPLEWLRVFIFCSILGAAPLAHGVEQAVPLDLASPAAGTLVICGGGDVPDSVMLHFIELAGGPQARIVFIPTAAQGADLEEIDEDLEFFRQQQLGSLTVFHTRSREKANDPEFARPLAEATGVWLGGGCQSLLTDVYLGTTAEELIRFVLNRGGVVGGISAGAAVMSPVMIRGGDLEPEVGQGFGLLPGTVIDQHFLKRNRQDRLLRVLKSHPGLVGIGIDESTALVVRGHHLTVMGDSDVVTCLSAGANGQADVQRLRPGDEADLAVLIQAALLRTQSAPSSLPENNRDVIIEPTIKPVDMPVHKPPSAARTQPPAAAAAGPAPPHRLVWDRRARRYVAAPPQRGSHVVHRRAATNSGASHNNSIPPAPGSAASRGRYTGNHSGPAVKPSMSRPAVRASQPRAAMPTWQSHPMRPGVVDAYRPWPTLAR